MDVKITLEPITEHEGKIWDEKKNSWKRASSFHSLGHARSHLKKKISAWDENETYAALRHIPDSPPAFQYSSYSIWKNKKRPVHKKLEMKVLESLNKQIWDYKRHCRILWN